MSNHLKPVFETRDVDEAAAVLSSEYSPHQLSIGGRQQRFHARHLADGFNGMSVHILSYGADVRAAAQPLKDYVLLSRVLKGRYRIMSAEGERVLAKGETVTLDPFTPYTMDFLDDCELMQVRIDQGAWFDALNVMQGASDPRSIRFSLTQTPDVALRNRCVSLMNLISHDAIPQDWAGKSPLIGKQLIQLAVAVMLDCPTHVAKTLTSVSDTSAVVAKALRFINLNCREEIGVAEIARAVKMSPRGLQYAFQKELSFSPMSALREARLRGAYDELQAKSTDEVSVTEVALAWGFSNLGRFAQEFYRRFDRKPSQVLRSSR